MNCSTPGFPVFHYLPELAQTHVHRVGDAMQSSHPLSSPSLPAFNLSQHPDLFQWGGSLHQGQSIGVSASPSVLPMNIQEWFPLEFTGSISLQSNGLSRVFCGTTIQNRQFFGVHILYGPTLTTVHDYLLSFLKNTLRISALPSLYNFCLQLISSCFYGYHTLLNSRKQSKSMKVNFVL